MVHGNIKLEQDQNEYRIDVTAESGTVRTYIIKLKNTEKTSTDIGAEDTDNSFEDEEKLQTNDIEQNSIETNNIINNNRLIYISIGAAIALIIFISIIIKTKTKRKKGKHNK